MPSIRVTVRSLRKMLEAADISEAPKDPHDLRGRPIVPPEDDSSTIDRVSTDKGGRPLADINDPHKRVRAAEYNASLGSGKPIKPAPEKKPVTKDFVGQSQQAPWLTRDAGKMKPLDMETLRKLNPRAVEEMPEKGHLGMRGPYPVLVPLDPVKKMLVWTGVPPRADQPEKRKAWRTVDELVKSQRDALGWIDQRDRGTAKNPTKPTGPVVAADAGVRFKGGAAGRVEPETMGSSPGGATGPGGTPTHQASAAAKRAFAAKGMSLPDWETLDIRELERSQGALIRHLKSNQDPELRRALQDVKAAIGDRMRGILPKPKGQGR